MTDKFVIIDTSHHNEIVDMAALKAGNVAGIIAKATQGDYRADEKFKDTAKRALDAGLEVAAYHWCDPMRPDSSQARFFLDTVGDLPISFAAADVEQFWQDWGEWALWVGGKGEIKRKIHPSRVSENGLNVLSYLDRYVDYPLMVYTNRYFIRDHAPMIASWMNQYLAWLAEWPYGKGAVTCTWDEFYKRFWPATLEPTLPPGCRGWALRQISGDKFTLPGVKGPLDINVFNGTLEQFKAFCGSTPPAPKPEPELPCAVKVVVDYVNIRTSPAIDQNKCGVLRNSAHPFAFELYRDKAGNDAARIGENMWIYLTYGGRVLAELIQS